VTKNPQSFDDLVITFKPDATPEAEARFIAELASAILAIARHLDASENEDGDLDP
jgi:hypothetical protein